MTMQSHEIACRSFKQPDECLDFKKHGKIDVLRMPHGISGMHAILTPGYRWSVDEKPLLGNPDACPMRHIGYCISGQIVVTMMSTGEQVQIKKGDFFEIPAGHDAYVPGTETCELVLFEANPT